ncbi:MAG: V-type ATP synthase subunit D [Candidatus Omnitrophica bacterium]|nr:V-type ATP synthase subunit D [Candidatus Omnitrophota bacterium]
MAKIKLTKGELKRQRDSLAQYERYLPTLQLKKQQLQIEILHELAVIEEKKQSLAQKRQQALLWAGLLNDGLIRRGWLIPEKITTGVKNVAGINIPVFESAKFPAVEYDLFLFPLWVDAGLEALRSMINIKAQIQVIKQGILILRGELRVTTQRVNLFEKVKIPEAKEAIRLIKVYLGDQLVNAVGRSKLAKTKIEAVMMEGAFV